MLSSWYDTALVLVNSQQLWLPAREEESFFLDGVPAGWPYAHAHTWAASKLDLVEYPPPPEDMNSGGGMC